MTVCPVIAAHDLRTVANAQVLIGTLAVLQIAALAAAGELTDTGEQVLAALREIRDLAAGAESELERLAQRLEVPASTPDDVAVKAAMIARVVAAARTSFGGPPS